MILRRRHKVHGATGRARDLLLFFFAYFNELRKLDLSKGKTCRRREPSPDMNRMSCAAKGTFKRVTHVIFDLDGLLLDTERLYTKAAQNVVSKYGKSYTFEIKQKVLGSHGEDAAKEVVKLLGLPLTWDEYYRQVKEQYPLVMTDSNFMPDTEGIYKKVFSDIAVRYGKVYTPEIRAKVIGTVEEDSAKIAVREMQLPLSPGDFLEEYKSAAVKSLANVGFMPGAEKLVKHFHSKQIPIAVATSSGQDTYDIKVAKHKPFFTLFNHIVTGGTDPDVKHGKPNPDIFLVCASRFKDKPKSEQCLVLEDAPNGVQAALAAGMQVIMVPDPQIDDKSTKAATLTLNSLEEVKPELFGLPPLE